MKNTPTNTESVGKTDMGAEQLAVARPHISAHCTGNDDHSIAYLADLRFDLDHQDRQIHEAECRISNATTILTRRLMGGDFDTWTIEQVLESAIVLLDSASRQLANAKKVRHS